MKVSIKGLQVDTDLGNKGFEISVYDGDDHLGDLFINRAKLIWCPGKSTPKSGGIPISWKDFIKLLEEE